MYRPIESRCMCGGDPGVLNRRGANDYVCATHIMSKMREVPYGRGLEVQCIGSSRIL